MKAVQQIVLLLVCLPFFAAQTTNTYSYAFHYNGTSGALTNPYYSPAYQLGVLSVNYSISVSFTLPNAGSSATELGNLVTAFRTNSAIGLQYIDSTNGSPQIYQAVTSASGTAISYPSLTSGNKYTFTYAVMFPTAYKLTSATFVLILTFARPIKTDNKLDYFTFEVNYYPTNQGISVGNTKQSTTILKIVDILRSDVVKLIYVSQANEIFNFTAFPTTYSCTNIGAGEGGSICTVNYVLNYYSITTASSFATYGFNGNQLTISAAHPITSNQVNDAGGADPVFVNSVSHYTQIFANPGFYLVEFQLTDSIYENAKVTYNSDTFTCPYDSSFGDYYSNFQGCTQTISPKGLPCASYNAITGTCALCLPGYTLVNGSCIANTTCPPRQYFHFGSCLDVSITCGSYDAFTGQCLNCSDSSNYDLINGNCLHKTITCAANQWQANYTCINVSSTCIIFDYNNGKCLNCLNNLYQLNSDGTCTLIVVTCSSGQYAVELNCVTIPVECLQFNSTLSKCLSCVKGYYVQNGTCQRIFCQNGQVPSNNGIFCIDVSPLCDVYDSITGDCLSCRYSGYAIRNGTCLQESSPLAGCKERQNLGFGPCVGAEVSCRTFNLVTGNCDKCNVGYYLDYTGHCVNGTSCGAGYWSVNNECNIIPDNCLKADSIGLCTQCVSNYRLEQGQCVNLQTCQTYQYLNKGGQCVDVSLDCATWNPSNGQCITCKTAGTHPFSGVCCPPDLIVLSGQCVSAAAYQNSFQVSTGPECVIRHPFVQICLKCTQGYSPDYRIPFGCEQS